MFNKTISIEELGNRNYIQGNIALFSLLQEANQALFRIHPICIYRVFVLFL